jgi:hypothetical protein
LNSFKKSKQVLFFLLASVLLINVFLYFCIKKTMQLFNKAKAIIAIIFLIVINFTTSLAQNNEQFMIGNWLGDIEFQGRKLPLVIRVISIEKDSFVAFMDSPDQGAKDIKVTKLLLRNDSAIIRIKSLGASISGLMSVKDSAIIGVFRQSIFNCPITLKKTDKLPSINRPQEPKPPFPYQITEVMFGNEVDNIELSGTLTVPSGNGKYPVVVMVSGSGPQNRDEEILGHKLFWVIADYLSRHGIAVLRYDDRGVGKSKGNFNEATTLNFSYDAEAAVTYLKTLATIDTNKIGIIGHSEGGMIAPMVASRNKTVNFIVLMAGPGLTGEEILLKQSILIAQAEGVKEKEINKANKLNKAIYEIVNREPDNTKAAAEMRKVYKKSIKRLSKEEKQLAEGQTNVMIQQVTSTWFRYFLKFNPKDYLTKTHCAVLALNGAKDLQVPADEDLTAIEEYLKLAQNKNYTIKKFENLNHLFQTCQTGALSEYSKIEETISPEVLSFMKDWILKVVK